MLMMKPGKQLVKFETGLCMLSLTFKVVKVLENYYNCSFLSASVRINYLLLNLLHSLKTWSCSNILKVCVSVAKYDDTRHNLFIMILVMRPVIQ